MVSSKSTRKQGSRLGPALEFFTINTYFFVRKNKNSKFFTLTGARPVNMLSGLKSSLKNIGFCYLAAELIDRLTGLEDEHAELFDITAGLAGRLSKDKKPVTEANGAYFKIKLLEICGFSVLSEKSYLSEKKNEIKRGDIQIMEAISASKMPHDFSIDSGAGGRINKFLDGYIFYTLGEELPGIRFFREVEK